MSENQTITGECLCGEVKLKAEHASNKLHVCHCEMCRRWGGGPLMAVDCDTTVKFKNENEISVYDSSEWAERGFCKHCGTHLFYRLKQNGLYIMPVGLLDGLTDIDFEGQIFVDQKPDYYEFANQTQMMTAEQVFAMFKDSQTND